MSEHVTLLLPDAAQPLDPRGISSAFPPEIQDQVRGRVRLLALLLLTAFGLDVVVYTLNWAPVLAGYPPPSDTLEPMAMLMSVVAASASAGLAWITRREDLPASRLHTLGLGYQIAICLSIAVITFSQYYAAHHLLPNLTWVPAVIILFPLIMPGPPARMLAAAIAAGAMPSAALLLLHVTGRIVASPDAYFQVTVHSGIAILFAYTGARMVYGLGREVTIARELGSYRLVEPLGQGGMGEVWRAKHRLLARPAAIKLVRPSTTAGAGRGISDDARRRFEREAQAIARLRSPHTVELFDFGVADREFYYVMELLDGLDLDTLVRRHGPVPAERAIHLIRQVCHSLSEAASCGLIHRDIKPANIFVCRYGEDDDFVKVLDFGIVKTAHTAAEPGAPMTQDHAIHGTPAFVAPEQALGGSDLDGRVDIYSTGCVAYWLLTGQLVFTGDTPMAQLAHHVHTPPPPPSTRTDLPISPALDALVLACLAKDPARRPQSARELSRRLAEVAGPRPWTEDRAHEWWAQHQPA